MLQFVRLLKIRRKKKHVLEQAAALGWPFFPYKIRRVLWPAKRLQCKMHMLLYKITKL